MLRIARPLDSGYVYSSQDYKAGELVTWAQTCLWLVGKSDLAVALLNKIDPHAAFACTMLGINIEDFSKKILEHANLRQAAKPWNFSKPGGGGVPTIALQARMQGEDTPHPEGPSEIEDGHGNTVRGFRGLRFCTIMRGEYCGGKDGKNKLRVWGRRGHERPIKPMCRSCLELGQQLEATWKRQWSEEKEYFKYVSSCVNDGMIIRGDFLDRWPWWREAFHEDQQLEPMQIAQLYSGRIRKVGTSAETPFCVIANSFFQAGLADVTKMAHRICVRECYDRTVRVPEFLFENSLPSVYAGGESPLFGSRIPGFFHDELLGEHPRSVAHDAATRMSDVMRDCMRHVCPDLADAAEAEPTLMNEWHKAAACVRDSNGRLIPWEPKR